MGKLIVNQTLNKVVKVNTRDSSIDSLKSDDDYDRFGRSKNPWNSQTSKQFSGSLNQQSLIEKIYVKDTNVVLKFRGNSRLKMWSSICHGLEKKSKD